MVTEIVEIADKASLMSDRWIMIALMCSGFFAFYKLVMYVLKRNDALVSDNNELQKDFRKTLAEVVSKNTEAVNDFKSAIEKLIK